MKKVIISFLILSGGVVFARGKEPVQTEVPYTLFGGPGECSMTVLELGYEPVVPRPRARKRPGKSFYSDVTVSDLPGVVFHLKRRGSVYVGYDGNTGHKIIVRGSGPRSKTPFSRGSYRLFEGRTFQAMCGKMILK